MCINAVILGIVSIQHRTFVEEGRTKVTVTFYAEQRPGRPNLGTPTCKFKWLTIEQTKQLPNYTIVKLIKKVESGGDCLGSARVCVL